MKVDVDDLPYDRIAFKAAHNSIDRDASLLEQLDGAGGLVEPCRGLELDLVQESDRFRWNIQHGRRGDGPDLGSILDQLVAWSNDPANLRHPVITIHLDLKNAPLSHSGFTVAFDDLLLRHFGERRLHRPEDVMRSHPDLVRGARSSGWPKAADLRGRFLLCLTGSGARKAFYARHEPRARVCFADYPGSRGAPRRGHRIFANLFVDARGYKGNLARVKRHPGFVARGYNIVHRRTWDLSVAGGANILAGDVLDSDDLSLGGEGMAPAFGGR